MCDVFTDRPLAGNQLAVFTDARGIAAETMQALARETNYSETTFVLPPRDGGDAWARIFTPVRELPFAGHPTLGTAAVLAAARGQATIRLETGAGIVPVDLRPAGESAWTGWMRQPIPAIAPAADPAALLAALGVARSRLPVEVYDNGIRHAFIALDSPEAVAAVVADTARLGPLTIEMGASTFAGSGRSWKTRMFAPGHGVTEDPATGSAAGPLALHLARHGWIAFGDEIAIAQGAELGRPSELRARVTGTADRVDGVEVGGGVVIVARGDFYLP